MNYGRFRHTKACAAVISVRYQNILFTFSYRIMFLLQTSLKVVYGAWVTMVLKLWNTGNRSNSSTEALKLSVGEDYSGQPGEIGLEMRMFSRASRRYEQCVEI